MDNIVARSGGAASFTLKAVIRHPGAGVETTSFNAALTTNIAIPEPATGAILGFALAGFSFLTRRRQRKA